MMEAIRNGSIMMFMHLHLSLIQLLCCCLFCNYPNRSFQYDSNKGSVSFCRSTKCAPAISGNNLNSRMPSMSEDFWSTSTCDLDELITLQSRQSSFISIINHNPKHGGGTDDLSNHSDFVNHGKLRSYFPLLAGKQKGCSFVCTFIRHIALVSLVLYLL